MSGEARPDVEWVRIGHLERALDSENKLAEALKDAERERERLLIFLGTHPSLREDYERWLARKTLQEPAPQGAERETNE